MTIQDVLREMRQRIEDECDPGIENVKTWAEAIEAAMREPKACYWMSSKWHRYEAHMADDLPCNAPHDRRPLYAFPPDADAEIERLLEALDFYADPETYFGLMVLGDPPCGAFADDFSDDHGHPYLDGPRYGKTARAALAGE